jgi:hypothetical protein
MAALTPHNQRPAANLGDAMHGKMPISDFQHTEVEMREYHDQVL